VSVPALITDLDRLGIRLEAHGDRLRYAPRSAVMPDLALRMKEHKGELLAILRRDTDKPPEDTLTFSTNERNSIITRQAPAEQNKTDYWWEQLSPDQQAELMPCPIKKPCPWCKRTEHTAICNELRWRATMPFGKHKGTPIDEVPRDYLQWLAKKKVRLPEDLRNEIYDTFGIVIHPVD